MAAGLEPELCGEAVKRRGLPAAPWPGVLGWCRLAPDAGAVRRRHVQGGRVYAARAGLALRAEYPADRHLRRPRQQRNTQLGADRSLALAPAHAAAAAQLARLRGLRERQREQQLDAALLVPARADRWLPLPLPPGGALDRRRAAAQLRAALRREPVDHVGLRRALPRLQRAARRIPGSSRQQLRDRHEAALLPQAECAGRAVPAAALHARGLAD